MHGKGVINQYVPFVALLYSFSSVIHIVYAGTRNISSRDGLIMYSCAKGLSKTECCIFKLIIHEPVPMIRLEAV